MKLRTVGHQLLFNTVRLETQDVDGNPLGVGTGFLLNATSDRGTSETFVVTNKHVVEGAWTLLVYFTREEAGEPKIGSPMYVRFDQFSATCHGHPEPDVDIAVAPVGWMLDLISKDKGATAYFPKISTNIIAQPETIEDWDVIRPILFVGYPNGLFDEENFTPIVRQGVTATPVQLDFNGQPSFLIDASVFPGSSGSPVFAYSLAVNGDILKVELIGILSAVFTQTDEGSFELVPAPTKVEPRVKFRHMIDLGLVWKAHLIKEAIDDFFRVNEAA